jgi:hypothetical protein
MRTTQEGMRLFNKHGKELTMDKLRDGHCLVISLWNTNTHKGRWSPTFRISAVPGRAPGKSTFISTYEYGSRARHRKARMWGYTSADGRTKCKLLPQPDGTPAAESCDLPQCEHNALFVSTKICNRRAGSAAQRNGPCEGMCGKYHPLDEQAIVNDRLWFMRIGGCQKTSPPKHCVEAQK